MVPQILRTAVRLRSTLASDFLLDGHLGVEPLDIGLAEKSDLEVGVAFDLAMLRFQLARHHVEQGRFTLAVFPDDADPVARPNFER